MKFPRWKDVDFSALEGETIVIIDKKENYGQIDELYFTTKEGVKYRMYHHQGCCESVYLAEIVGGELTDLLFKPIVFSECVSEEGKSDYGTSTWTFYKLSTERDSLTLRWFGESNGYYSEEVSFEQWVDK